MHKECYGKFSEEYLKMFLGEFLKKIWKKLLGKFPWDSPKTFPENFLNKWGIVYDIWSINIWMTFWKRLWKFLRDFLRNARKKLLWITRKNLKETLVEVIRSARSILTNYKINPQRNFWQIAEKTIWGISE